MKEDNIYQLKKMIRNQKDGLKFIKSVNIGIPFARLSLDVTIRRELEFPFFNEITMKLLEKGWNNYNELSSLMGLDLCYMDNILAELGSSDYIRHIGRQIYLTEKGKQELSQLKSVKIEPEILNNICINLIDGSIISGSKEVNLRKSINSKLYMHEKFIADMKYIINIEKDIRDLYTENEKKEDSLKKAVDFTIRNELYRVIDIQKQELLFYEEIVDVYVTEDDNTVQFIFNSNNFKQNEIYSMTLREQLVNNQNSLDNVFDNRYYYQNKMHLISNSEFNPNVDLHKLYEKKYKLEALICKFQADNNKELKNEIEEIYYSNRIMLYGEYKEILFSLLHINFQELYLMTNNIYSLTGDGNIISIIKKCSEKSKVYFGYNIGQNANFAKNIEKNSNINFFEYSDLKVTKILVKDHFMITIYYVPIKSGNNIILEQIPIFCCNKETIYQEINIVKNLYRLD